MGYYLELCDPVTGKALRAEKPHFIQGSNVCEGGTDELSVNITYNYGVFFNEVLAGGLRSLYGMTGATSIPILKKAISELGDDVKDDYWKPTEGNAKRALCGLLAFAQMRPDGIWSGD